MSRIQARPSAKVAMVTDEMKDQPLVHYQYRSGAWKVSVSCLLLVLIPNCRRCLFVQWDYINRPSTYLLPRRLHVNLARKTSWQRTCDGPFIVIAGMAGAFHRRGNIVTFTLLLPLIIVNLLSTRTLLKMTNNRAVEQIHYHESPTIKHDLICDELIRQSLKTNLLNNGQLSAPRRSVSWRFFRIKRWRGRTSYFVPSSQYTAVNLSWAPIIYAKPCNKHITTSVLSDLIVIVSEC